MSIERFYLFSQLEPDEREMIEKQTLRKKLHKDAILFYQGEPSEHLYMLSSGVLKAYKTDANGKEIILHHFKAPCFVAEMATLEGIPFPATLSAESDAEVLSLKRELFLQLIELNSSLAFGLIRSMSKKIKILESTIERNMTLTSLQRVVKTILETPELFRQLPQTKIATMLNMTPETLSRMLKKLRADSLIELDGRKLKVLDPGALAQLLP